MLNKIAIPFVTFLICLGCWVAIGAEVEPKAKQRAAKTPPQTPRNSSAPTGYKPFDVDPSTHMLVYGNGFAERLLDAGYFEAHLHTQIPKVSLRSMALNGDQVHHRSRPTGFENHMRQLLEHWRADKVLLFFGANEALDTNITPAQFESNLKNYLKLITKRHPDAELVFVAPIAYEDLNNPRHPKSAQVNERFADYVNRIENVCADEFISCINLFEASKKLFASTDEPLTTNGLYLNEAGNRIFGRLLAQAITDKALPERIQQPAFANLVNLVRDKAASVKDAFHPTNAIHYYGLRARSYEYDAEIPHHLYLADLIDRTIWKQATSRDVVKLAKLPARKATPPGGRAPRRGLGKLVTPEQDMKDFTVADGFDVNLFASSEQFPELINPLQMAVDKKGRVWVATFATYPVPIPGRKPIDKILIFEDTNADGQADVVKTFAENLLLPDGFAFYGDGIVVSVPWKLVWLRDTDGDDRADTSVEVLTGLDNTDSHHAGFLSLDTRGNLIVKDGLFHRAQLETPWGVVHAKNATIMTFDMKRSRLSVENQPNYPNPWKVAHNRWGEAFQMFGGGQISDMNMHDVYTPIGITQAHLGFPFRDDKGCTLEVVSGTNFPDAWQGGLLTGHLLSQNYVLYTPVSLKDGTYLKSGNSVRLIQSSNKAFRPVDLVFGLDGALLISDFYYPIIGHAQHSIRDKNRDYSSGRIWRVTHKAKPLAKAPAIVGASIKDLIDLLQHSQVRIRELARMELGERKGDDVLKQMGETWSKISDTTSEANDNLALELVWLYERLEHFSNVDPLKHLLASKNALARGMAIRSLRFWINALGTDAVARHLKDSIKSSDARVAVQSVSTLSHLQRTYGWAKSMIQQHQAQNQVIARMLAEARKIDMRPLADSYPILSFDRTTRLNTWGTVGTKKTTYFRAKEWGQPGMLFTDSSMPTVILNDTIVFSAQTLHTKTRSLAISLQKGMNKLEIVIPKPRRKNDRINLNVPIYLTNQFGEKPDIDLPTQASKLKPWAKEFDVNLETNWRSFAQYRYQSTCASCHSLDGTRLVGPSFKGLLGREQVLVSPKGKKRRMTVDADHIRKSILFPGTEFPESYQPLMPKSLLTSKEVDLLVRFLTSPELKE